MSAGRPTRGGCPSEQTLLEYMAGRLSPEARRDLDEHLDRCPDCLLALAAATRARASRGPTAPAADDGPPTLPAGLPEPAELSRGTSLGRYVVLQRLGQGGMGVVYAAYDPVLDRRIALKLLGPDGSTPAPEARARLLREAQAMARLAHPNVVPVHDVGSIGERVFLAMELMPGGTLGAWLRAGARPWREVLGHFTQAGRGLAAAHAAGLVHRDFKPDNVLLDRDGHARVTDFGLARLAGEAPGPAPASAPPPAPGALASPLTLSGACLGTPAYMAPEQRQGLPADARTDQYSFCVALYEGLYGRLPFAGRTPAELAEAAAAGRVVEPPADGRVPARVRRALLRGLAREPGQRHADMQALLQELQRASRRRARRVGLAIAASAALAAAAALTLFSLGGLSAPCQGAGERLRGVWDPTRRASVQRAFQATGAPAAGESWEAVRRLLDRYADQWAAMRTEACEATQVRGEQSPALLDLRMACLDRRAEELGALAGVLERADAATLRRAPMAAAGLGDLTACADSEALRALIPPPTDPATRARVAALRTQLAQAKAHFSAGQLPQAAEAAGRAVAAAREVGYPPALAEALDLQGRVQDLSGDPQAALETLWQAAEAALAGRHDEEAVLVLAHLAFVHGNELEQWDLARHVIGQADAICRRLGDRPALRAVVENNRGNLEGGQDHHPQAYEHHRRAVELWERLHGAAHPRVARAYGNLSIDARKLGRLDESLTLAQRSLEQLQAALGPEHPDLQMAHQNLGNLFADQQQPERAIEHFRRALAIAERSEGPQGPGAVSALLSIGVVQDDFGRYPEALRTYRRALEAARAAYGEAHPKVAACLNNIGNVLQRQGQHAEALPLHESALAILVGALGEDSSETFMELNNIGAAYLGLGKPLLAEPFLTRAERRFDAARWEDKDLAELRSNQAEVRWAQGDHARALALAEEARALLAAGGARDREELRRVEAWIAGHRPTR